MASAPDNGKPRLSVLLCTYNGEDLLPACLDSILRQDCRDFEVLCLDGKSQDGTQRLIQEYASRDSRVRLVVNENRLPEGRGNGKWLGARAAAGEILVIIDQDNALQRADLFSVAISFLEREPALLGVLGGLKNDHSDTAVVRFVSLFGTDCFFAYRSVDFLRSIGRQIREERVAGEDCERVTMTVDNLPLTGGNCFFYRKRDVESVGGYDQDVLVVKRLVQSGKSELAIVKSATKHYAENSLARLAVKKFFWGRTFFEAAGERFNYWPATQRERNAFFRNFLFNLLILPNAWYSWRAFRRSGDWVAWLFPAFAFLNTLAYGLNFLFAALRKRAGAARGN